MNEKNNFQQKEVKGEEGIFDLSNTQIDNDKIGSVMLCIRKALHMTKNEMSKEIDVPVSTIEEIEKGEDENLSLDINFRLYFLAREMLDNKFLECYIIEKVEILKDEVRSNIIEKMGQKLEQKLKEEMDTKIVEV